MSRSRMWFVVAVAALMLAAPAVAGPTGQYVLTAGDQHTDWVVQGAGVNATWTTTNSEYPLIVLGTVRATSPSPGGVGGGYTLAGVPTGATYTNGLGEDMYDAATDGANIYVINWTTGDLTRLDLTWSNPQVLFHPGAGGSALAITYDPTNNSLWIGGWTTGTIANYSLTGTLLSSFTVPYTELTCLAMDYTDNTLWFGSQATLGTFHQYSRTGTPLGTQVYPALVGQNTLGGEFPYPATPAGDVPALGTAGVAALVLLVGALGLLAVARMRTVL